MLDLYMLNRINDKKELASFCKKSVFNPSLTNVPFTDKPGSWFLLAKCLKNSCRRVIF